MKKKSSASSQPVKLVTRKAEDIVNKPLTRQRAVLKRLKARPDSHIDYSDIPQLTDKQLAQFRRTPKVLIAARLDREVYDWLKQFGQGYSTRINSTLRAVMSKSR